MNRIFPCALFRVPALVLGCLALCGCMATATGERTPLVAPTAISDMYSSVNLQMMLATTSNASDECAAAECMQRSEFDQRVASNGARLAEGAYVAFPGLAERVSKFNFLVVDKAEPGTASTAAGNIVVLRPLSSIAVTDEALSFVIAREMGHVVAQHHEENTATSMLMSVIATVIAPIVNIAKLLAIGYSGASTSVASSAVASASMTEASFVGSRVVIESYRPKQREEADGIAIRLLEPLGYDAQVVSAAFEQVDLRTPPTSWMRELQDSVARLAAPPALAQARQLETARQGVPPVN